MRFIDPSRRKKAKNSQTQVESKKNIVKKEVKLKENVTVNNEDKALLRNMHQGDLMMFTAQSERSKLVYLCCCATYRALVRGFKY